MKSDLRITVHETNNFTPKQLVKYKEAVLLTEAVLNSERFKKLLLELKLTSTKGFSNQQIYDMMMSGAETLEPEEDNEVDVFVTMYYRNNRVVGYTYGSTRETWLNSKFFDAYNHAEIAANLIHEWMHKLGFGHQSAKEHSSVPYAVGYLVEDCIKELLTTPDLYADVVSTMTIPQVTIPPKKVCKRLWYTFWTRKVCWYE